MCEGRLSYQIPPRIEGIERPEPFGKPLNES